MAKVRLTDVIDVKVYQDLPAEHNPELTSFFESGVVIRDPLADSLANASGQDAELPYWLDIDPSIEPNYSTDQDGVATPLKVSQDSVRTRKAYLNQGWSAMDLARELQTNTDAMAHIKNRVDKYYTRQWQRRTVATTKGILNANIAGNLDNGTAGDMVNDISIEDGDASTSANWFSRAAFNTARFTMGDHVDNLAAMLVHSVIAKRMSDNDDIDFIMDSKGEKAIPTFMGHRIIIDDGVPVIAGGTTGFRYVTTLYGKAAFAYGSGTPMVPVELDRVPAQGDGGGDETLWVRKTWLIHPAGHDNLNATSSEAGGLSQNLADLALETNWHRKHFRKNVPIAFLITNG